MILFFQLLDYFTRSLLLLPQRIDGLLLVLNFLEVFLVLDEISNDRGLFQIDPEAFIFFKLSLIKVEFFSMLYDLGFKFLALYLYHFLFAGDDVLEFLIKPGHLINFLVFVMQKLYVLLTLMLFLFSHSNTLLLQGLYPAFELILAQLLLLSLLSVALH